MSKIKWMKNFTSITKKGRFRLFVSENENGAFYATALFYEKSSAPEGTEFDMKNKLFLDDSEQAVFEEARNWILQNVDEDAEFRIDN